MNSSRAFSNGGFLGCIAVLGLLLSSVPAHAQSDILLQLRSGSPPGDRMRVDSAGGFVSMGVLGVGIIPAIGVGERTMWYPFRGAFRSGSISGGIGGCEACWNDANMGFYSWAGGINTMGKGLASFAFGSETRAEGQYSIAFGDRSVVTAPAGGPFGTGGVAMGIQSTVNDRAGVAMGELATSNGDAAISLGYRTSARADYAMALGRAGVARHLGSFVWGGISSTAQTDSVESSAAGEFTVRAPGGIRLRTNATLTTGCNLLAGGGVWNCASSRTLKENFVAVDGERVLASIRSIPVSSWNYIGEGAEVRHLGPFAEDFFREFGLGSSDLSIGHLDIDGVNFAGVQALERRTFELRATLDQRDRDMAALEERIRELEARNASLEKRLASIEELLGTAP